MTPADPQSVHFWHTRFLEQAAWTASIRQKVLSEVEPRHIDTIIEVGSGTGVILKELSDRWPTAVIGLDLDRERLRFSQDYSPQCLAVQGDGMRLPFMSSSIDLSLCHFLLLWVVDPLTVLREMTRVTRAQGWIMALAEPDYGGRVDHPPQLAELGQLQIEGLQKQGADPSMGRHLFSLFLEAGLTDVKTGILGAEWRANSEDRAAQEEEWAVLITDIEDAIDPHQLAALKISWFEEGRILYVPTFYAIGKVPG
jgi:SAM-dependent methyltransferase